MTPNTDNPDKPPANQGDELFHKRLREILSSYAKYISLEDQSHMWRALETQLVALHHRQLAERLQMVLDKLPDKKHIPDDWIHEPGRTAIYSEYTAINKTIDDVANAIKQLIPN
jgi:hypothetical protein